MSTYISCLLSARKDKGILKLLSRPMSQLAATSRAKPTRRTAGRMRKHCFFSHNHSMIAVHKTSKFGPQLCFKWYLSLACTGLEEVFDLTVIPL